MAAYEQKVEPPDKKWQYLLFAAEPYETIAFKVSFCHFTVIVWIDAYIWPFCNLSQVPSREVDKEAKRFWTHWNKETKQVTA